MSASSLASPTPPWVSFGRATVALLGVVAFSYVVCSVGAGRLLDVAARAGMGILVLVALEVAILGLETHAAHTLSTADARDTLRGAIAAYTTALLVPGGRVAGEIARIARLRGASELGRTVHASLVIQAAHVASTVVALVVTLLWVPLPASLVAMASGVAAWNAGLSIALFATPRSSRAITMLATRVGVEGLRLASVEGRMRAITAVLLGRGLHWLQAAVAVALVTGRLDASAGAIAECLQVLAGAAGDAIPGQVGLLEAGFDTYGGLFDAHDLGAGVAIALLLRASRLALLGPLGLAWWTTRSR